MAATADAPRNVHGPLDESAIRNSYAVRLPGDAAPLRAPGLRMDQGDQGYAQQNFQLDVTGTVYRAAATGRGAAAEASRSAVISFNDASIQESYLYRLPGDAAPLVALDLRLDKDYGLQRLKRDVPASDFRIAELVKPPMIGGAAGGASGTDGVEKPRSVTVVLGHSLSHDTNVLQLPGNVSAQSAVGVPSRSDTINVIYAGLRIDKSYAQQRVELDVTETAYRYANLSYLNFDALEYRGVWHWRVTPRWGGTLSTERRIALASFADSQFAQRRQRNLRTSDDHRVAVDGEIGGGLHAILGAFQRQLKYDQGFLPQNSSRTQGAEIGVKYQSAAGNRVSLIQRSARGEYLNGVIDVATVTDNGFREKETELKLEWNASGKSVVRGRLTWLDVYHEHFAQRDFSGLAGEVGYIWTPSGKLRIDVLAKRDISSWWQPFSSYKVDHSLSITPTWQVGAKTSMRLRFERIHSDFRGPVFPPTGPLRADTLNNVQLGAEWAPLRSLEVGASLQRQWRSSNATGADFDATIGGINARLKF